MRISDSESIILLGAGSSKEAGLPLASELTDLALTDAQSWGQISSTASKSSALNYVVSTLIKFEGDQGGNPRDLPNIERVASAIELLHKRQSLEVAPFVERWDDAMFQFSRSESATGFDRDFEQLRQGLQVGSYELLIRRLIRDETGTDSRETWNKLSRSIVDFLCGALSIRDGANLDYLSPLITGIVNSRTIVTLNYDLTLETLARRLEVPYSVGVEDWSQSGRINWNDAKLRIVKLHGSINWDSTLQSAGNGRLQTIGVEVRDQLTSAPTLLLGTREKLRSEGPFLDLMAEFNTSLAKCKLLVVIGYSFGDEHINDIISRWINIDLDRRMVVVNPSFPVDDFRFKRNPTFADQLETSLSWQTTSTETHSTDRLTIARTLASTSIAGFDFVA